MGWFSLKLWEVLSHRFTSNFVNPSFSVSERLTYNVLKYDNFKSVEVQCWTPLKILIFLQWTLRPTFTMLLGKPRAISQWMGVPKNGGKCKSATISLHRGDSLSMSSVVCISSKLWYWYCLSSYAKTRTIGNINIIGMSSVMSLPRQERQVISTW